MMRLFTKSVSEDEISEFVWIQTSFIGDVVLTTGAMAKLREAYPDRRQVFIGHGPGCSVIKMSGVADAVVEFQKKKNFFRSVRVLRNSLKSTGVKNPVILLPHLSIRSRLLALFLGFPTVGFDAGAFSFLNWRTICRVTTLHEASRIGLLLTAFSRISRAEVSSIKPKFIEQDFPIPVAMETHLTSGASCIAIAPGSVWATKCWPKEYFSRLIEKILLDDHNQKIIICLLGSNAEKSVADGIEQDLIRNRTNFSSRIVNLAGKTSLAEMAGLIKRSTLLVANDSSPIHFASAFDVPTVAIFGATVPALGFAPLATHHAVAEISDLECRPCSDHGPKVCPLEHFRCMKDLSPDMVYGRVQDVLKSVQQKSGAK